MKHGDFIIHKNQDFNGMYAEYTCLHFCAPIKTLQFSICVSIQYNESKPKKAALAWQDEMGVGMMQEGVSKRKVARTLNVSNSMVWCSGF